MNKPIGCVMFAMLILAAPAIAEDDGGMALYEEQCSKCHFEDDFSGESEEAIAGMINGIIAGEVDHKSELTGLSEEDVKKLAAYFASQ